MVKIPLVAVGLLRCVLVATAFQPSQPLSHRSWSSFLRPIPGAPVAGRITQTLSSTVLDSFLDTFPLSPRVIERTRTCEALEQVVLKFVSFYNAGNTDGMLSLLTEDCKWDDYAFSSKAFIKGKSEIERRYRLQNLDKFIADTESPVLVVDKIAAGSSLYNEMEHRVCIRFHKETNGEIVPTSRGAAWFELSGDARDVKSLSFQSIRWVAESADKQGENGLRVLGLVSKFLGTGEAKDALQTSDKASTTNAKATPEKYFAAWNQRDIDAAVAGFAEDVTYDDTAFPDAFQGKENVRKHLKKVENALPSSFTFEVDDLVIDGRGGTSSAVLWHVENNGQQLEFTRGCSVYLLNKENLIEDGIDFVEPGPIKYGTFDLWKNAVRTMFSKEPVRFVAVASWFAYMYIVFFSDGILPGANALQLEQRTWEEVRDLSLNFFLVSPLLGLPFSPVVHPMLEGVFNVLLSWAALFAGFFSDDRRDKPNLFPMIPAVIGMQFLTSAFLLPYLALRSPEQRDDVTLEDLSTAGRVCESKSLGIALSLVGGGSIVWAFIGRMSEFGELPKRWSSFLDLLSIDRVGSSFIVDLAIFALFQSWFIDDDLKRRGVDVESDRGVRSLALIGKYLPFFGMAAYLINRPQYPSKDAS